MKRKSIGLRSEAQRVAYWKLVDDRRVRLERVVEGIVSKRLDADVAAAVSAIEAGRDVNKAIDGSRAAWLKDLERIYLTVGEPFASAALDDLEKSAPSLDRVKATPEWQRRLGKYLARVGAAKVTQILDTTKARIATVLDAGIADEEGIPELAKRVRETMTSATPARARMIARTETVSASNAASMAAAESTGLPLVKEWISTKDARTRSSHDAMDGETTAMDDVFHLEGGDVEFPGDSSLGVDAAEVVNCRCTHAFQVSS